MIIRGKLRNLIALQDEITHLNETRGDIDLIRAKQVERDGLMDEIVDVFGELRNALDISIRALERNSQYLRQRAETTKILNELEVKYGHCTHRS